MADAEVGGAIGRGEAGPVIAVQVARGLVAEMTLPPIIADAGVRLVNASSVLASWHLLTKVAVLSCPSVVADALVGLDAVAVGAVGANRDVAVGPFPITLAVALESI